MESKYELEKKAKDLISKNPAEAVEIYRMLWDKFSEGFNDWDAFFSIKALRASSDPDLGWAKMIAEKFNNEKVTGLYAWLVYDTCVKGRPKNEIINTEQTINSLVEISSQKNLLEDDSFPCPTTLSIFKLIDAHSENMFNARKINSLLDCLNVDYLSTSPHVITTKERGEVELASDFEKHYALKTKALLKLEEFPPCKELCEEALKKIKKFHYDNDIWFRLRIAICNEKLGNLAESESQFKALLSTRVGSDKWFIYSHIAELYYEQGNYNKAWEYAVQATFHSNEPEYMRGLYTLQIRILNKLGRMNEDGKLLAELIAATIKENQWKVDDYYSKMFKYFEVNIDELKNSHHYLKEAQRFWTQERYKDVLKNYGEIDSVHKNGKIGRIKDAYGKIVDFHRKDFTKRPRDLNEIVGSKVEFYIMPSFDGRPVAENITITDIKQRAADDRVGKQYEGTVKSIVEFGLFVRIDGVSDGLLHKSKIPKNAGDFRDVFKQGDKIKVEVAAITEKGIDLKLVV